MKGTANPFLFVCREATFRHELMILMLTWELLLLCIITDPFIAVLGCLGCSGNRENLLQFPKDAEWEHPPVFSGITGQSVFSGIRLFYSNPEAV